MGRAGLALSAPTQLELLWRTAKWLRPEYELILSKVRNSRVVHTDQTGIKVAQKRRAGAEALMSNSYKKAAAKFVYHA